ncbi:MAG: amidohydrolase family protein [Spirochaetales bacterium]|nr:amidohydrolase family protein [Spirochaetales bacterium]
MNTIKARTLYTGTEVLKNAFLNYDKGTIHSVTDRPAGDLLKTFPVVTPAFIDAHSHIGMIRMGEPSAEAEANDRMDSIIAHADALDSVMMDDRGFIDSIEAGILYSCILPGSGNILSGTSAVVRNYGRDTTEALIARSGIKAAFGYNPMSAYSRDAKGTRPYTRMGALAILRGRLTDVRNKLSKKEPEPLSAEDAVLAKVLAGKERLRVHVHKADDIASLLRLVDEFKLKITVEHSSDVHDIHIYQELAKRDIPVVYGPLDTLAYKVELKHDNWRNIRYLIDSGVYYGLMTDHPVIMQNMLLFELRWFLRHGLSKQECLEIITRKNAVILGINDRLGTLEKGKWASFVCWNADPFDLKAYPVLCVGEGKEIYSEK